MWPDNKTGRNVKIYHKLRGKLIPHRPVVYKYNVNELLAIQSDDFLEQNGEL